MEENLRRKLLYKSKYRGIKELDLIIGRFAEENIYLMSLEELLNFENFLELDEMTLANFLIYRHPIPEDYIIIADKIINSCNIYFNKN